MKIIFMGTPDFACRILEEIMNHHDVVSVFCQPDKKKGRRGKVVAPPVKKLAQEHGIPVHQPFSLKSPQTHQSIAAYEPDIIVVAAYGKILPPSVLEIPSHGCLNVHASLLPEYRGASPIQWALWQGEKETGVSIMLMDEGMDTGPVLSQKAVPIQPEDNYFSLSKALAVTGSQLLADTIIPWVEGNINPQVQDSSQATYAPLLKKEMGLVNWEWNTEKVINHLRAFCEWPKSFTWFRGKKIILEQLDDFRSLYPPSRGKAGEIIEVLKKEGIVVRTGDGTVLLKRLSLENKKSMSGQDFVNGYQPRQGEILQSS